MNRWEREIIDAAVLVVSAVDSGADTIPMAALRAAVHASNGGKILAPNTGSSVVTLIKRESYGGNYTPERIVKQIVECLTLGLSQRETARECKVNKATVARYENLNGPFTCPCGRSRSHRGWCGERIKRSPNRQKFLSGWFERSVAAGVRKRSAPRAPMCIEPRVVKSNWPYLRGGATDTARLVEAVNEIVPRGLPDHVRADICQDVLLSVLEGETSIASLKDGSAKALKKYYKQYPGKFGPLSLDAVIPGTNNLRLIDTIADDHPHA